MQVNNNSVLNGSIGESFYRFFVQKKIAETLTFVMSKGKIEFSEEDIERINIFDNSTFIVMKNGDRKFINLNQITYVE